MSKHGLGGRGAQSAPNSTCEGGHLCLPLSPRVCGAGGTASWTLSCSGREAAMRTSPDQALTACLALLLSAFSRHQSTSSSALPARQMIALS